MPGRPVPDFGTHNHQGGRGAQIDYRSLSNLPEAQAAQPLGNAAMLNVGTTPGTVAAGDHAHGTISYDDLAGKPTLGNAAALNTGSGNDEVAVGDHDHDEAYLPIADGLPSGIIVMWSGLKSAIPAGWLLCDGNNGTPNLLDKFILSVGAASEAGGTGGSTTISHEGTAVADHAAQNHAGAGVADHPATATAAANTGATKIGSTTSTATLKAHTHLTPVLAHTVTQPEQHPALQHSVTQPADHTNVKPPYFLLAFIMKA